MGPFKSILLPCLYSRFCAIALAATLPTLGPAQLPDLSLSPNLTSLTLPSSNLTSLYDNLTFLELPSSNVTLLPNQTLHTTSLKDNPLPPDPTSIQYSLATIRYSGYGPMVNIADVWAVFRAVLFDCQLHSPEARMGLNTRTYTVGSASLRLTPEPAMYWSIWAFVREKLLSFAIQYGYPQFDFAIMALGSDQLLGSGKIRPIQPRRLPPDPFYMEFSQGVVKFSSYGPAISKIITLRVITDAAIDCSLHPDPIEIIDAAALMYTEGPVSLTLGPGPLLTWAQWTAVLSLIGRFLDAYEYMDFNFNIWNGQQEIVGSGSLKSSDS